MPDFSGIQVAEVVALTLDPDFVSFYSTQSKHPPPVEPGDTYKPSEIGEKGFMALDDAETAQTAGDVILTAGNSPLAIQQAIKSRT